MIKEARAGCEEFFLCFHSADFVLKVFVESLYDIDKVFFHLLDMFEFDEVRDFPRRFLKEEGDVFHDHFSSDERRLFACESGTELFEDPGIPDGSASNHEAGGPGSFEVGEPGLAVHDVAIGDDGARESVNGLGHPIFMHRCLITFFDSAAVDGEQVDGVF